MRAVVKMATYFCPRPIFVPTRAQNFEENNLQKNAHRQPKTELLLLS